MALPEVRELLQYYTNKPRIMSAVGKVWPKGSMQYVLIEKAYLDSIKGHRGQLRNSGEQYFRHILGVVVILLVYKQVYDVNLIVAAFLHDLIEDHPKIWSFERVYEEYGLDVACLVWSVTKPNHQFFGGKNWLFETTTVLKVLQGGRRSVMLRLADRLHNMHTLWGNPHKKRRKIKETEHYYLPLARTFHFLESELEEATKKQCQIEHIDNEDDISAR